MAYPTLYPPQTNSPSTTLAADISSSDTNITVADGSVLPTQPTLLTIGDGDDAETILMVSRTGGNLSVQRGIEGVQQAWTAGETISRNFTAQDHRDINEWLANLKADVEGKANASHTQAATTIILEQIEGMSAQNVQAGLAELKGRTDTLSDGANTAKTDISALQNNKLNTNGNGSAVTAIFSQALNRVNLASGETLAVLFGKIAKWFIDLGTAAFRDTGTGADDVATGNHTHSQYLTAETDPTVPAWAKTANKPSYTAADVGAIPTAQKAAANGVASLGSDTKVPAAQLPAASTTAPGISQLNNTVTSTSATQAATAGAVKTAYDKGSAALEAAGVADGKAETAQAEATSAQSAASAAQSAASAAVKQINITGRNLMPANGVVDLKITVSSVDLTPGVSALETGALYFVYE